MAVRIAKINGILYKDVALFDTLQRSVRLLSGAIPNPEINAYDGYFGATGSATIVRYRGRHYAICTRHQVRLKHGVPPPASLLESLVVTSVREANPTTGRNQMGHIPFDRCHYDDEAGDEEYGDLLFLEALETYEGIGFDRPHFFEIAAPRGVVLDMVAIGNPSAGNNVHYEPTILNIFSKALYCEEDAGFTSSASHLKRYSYSDDLPIVDGLSGGAVFSFRRLRGATRTYLEAIIVRGGNGSLYGISIEYLLRMLERIPQR